MSKDTDAGKEANVAGLRRRALVCRRCAHPIGEFLGPRAVKLGGAVVRSRITYYCSICKHRWNWRPAGQDEES